MPKKQWTAEERKAFGDKMRAAREARAAEVPEERVENTLENQQKAEQMERQHLSKSAVEHGLVTPAGGKTIAQIIAQRPAEELEMELDDLTAEEFIAKHTRAEDANRDLMAKVLRMSRDEVAQIQRELGFPLPDGI